MYGTCNNNNNISNNVIFEHRKVIKTEVKTWILVFGGKNIFACSEFCVQLSAVYVLKDLSSLHVKKEQVNPNLR